MTIVLFTRFNLEFIVTINFILFINLNYNFKISSINLLIHKFHFINLTNQMIDFMVNHYFIRLNYSKFITCNYLSLKFDYLNYHSNIQVHQFYLLINL